jgi:hypothetical protein
VKITISPLYVQRPTEVPAGFSLRAGTSIEKIPVGSMIIVAPSSSLVHVPTNGASASVAEFVSPSAVSTVEAHALIDASDDAHARLHTKEKCAARETCEDRTDIVKLS